MKTRSSLVLLLSSLLLPLGACKRGGDDSRTTVASEETPAAEEVRQQQEENAEAAAEEIVEEKPAIDTKTVDAWIAERREKHAAIREYTKKVAELEKSKPGAIEVAAKMPGMVESFEKEIDAIEKKHGLKERERQALDELAVAVMGARMIATEDALKSVTESRKNLANVPAEQRAEAEAQIAQMEKLLNDQKNMTEQRVEWGDTAVDAVLARADEIVALWKDGATLSAPGAN